MKKVVIDIETVSAVDLKKVGSLNYAKHSSTNISEICWMEFNSGKTYSLTHPLLTSVPNSQEAKDAIKMLKEADRLIAHNAPFEKNILNYCLEEFLNDCEIKPLNLELTNKDFIDTMTLAQIFHAPAALKSALKYFNLPELKDELGHKVMKAVCKLALEGKERKTTAAKVPCHVIPFKEFWAKGGPDVYSIMRDYCRQDVIATDGLYYALTRGDMLSLMGDFKDEIIKGMKTTQNINERGIKVDMLGAMHLKEAKELIDEKLDKSTKKYFGVEKGTKKAAIIRAIDGIESLERTEVEEFIHNSDDENVVEGLKERLIYNKPSLSKAAKILDIACDKTSRIYDMFKFCGAAATGRWASFGVQLQNLPRPSVDFKTAVDFLNTQPSDYNVSKETPDLAVSAIRALFVPEKGYKFLTGDFSQVELRWSMWRSGHKKDVIEMSEGICKYQEMAETLFKRKVEKKSDERYIGKQLTLAAQYGLGGKGLQDRIKMYSIKELGRFIILKENEAADHIKKFRHKYPGIVKAWRRYDKKLRLSVGKEFKVKLVTGRWLNYGKIRERTYKCKFTGKMKKSLVYWDGARYKDIYGGKIYQNVIQAECRDMMLIKANALDELKARIVSIVHDELIIEVEKDAEMYHCQQVWKDAGSEKIKKYFGEIPIDSDLEFKTRYYK